MLQVQGERYGRDLLLIDHSHPFPRRRWPRSWVCVSHLGNGSRVEASSEPPEATGPAEYQETEDATRLISPC